MNDLISSLSSAIAKFEGYFNPGTVAARNNNPGNLRSGPRAIGTDAHGYAIYQTVADGWADLQDQIQRNVGRGLTLAEFFGGKPGVYAGYAPAADSNNPNGYASFVAGQVGIPTNIPLSQLAGDNGAAGGGAATSTGDSASAADSGGLSVSWPMATWTAANLSAWPGWLLAATAAAGGVIVLRLLRR